CATTGSHGAQSDEGDHDQHAFERHDERESDVEGAVGHAGSSPSDSSGTFGMVGMVILVLIGVALWSNSSRAPMAGPPPVAVRAAPEYFVEQGACPYEGCRSGVRWLALAGVPAYAAPPERPTVTPRELTLAMTIHTGEWVTTETGTVISIKRKGRLVNGSHYGIGSSGPPIQAGSIVPVYTG